MTIRTCLCLIIRPSPADGPVADGPVAHGPVADGPAAAAAGAGAAGQEVLLGFKKTGFGAGRWVGLGGHIEDGEEPADAAVREVAEESGLVVAASDVTHLASLRFVFPARPSWDQTAEVFLATEFAGQAAESDELIPRWFAVGSLPLDGMWDDARYWLPLILAGYRVSADITFAEDCATVAAIDPDPRTPAAALMARPA